MNDDGGIMAVGSMAIHILRVTSRLTTGDMQANNSSALPVQIRDWEIGLHDPDPFIFLEYATTEMGALVDASEPSVLKPTALTHTVDSRARQRHCAS